MLFTHTVYFGAEIYRNKCFRLLFGQNEFNLGKVHGHSGKMIGSQRVKKSDGGEMSDCREINATGN